MPAPPLVRVHSNVGGVNREVTEDTPADLLEGCMEVQVVLPNKRKIRAYYERRTPMMDLLVQIATKQRLAPGDHFLQITDEVTGNSIPFLPNTVLGALDVRTVEVVAKNRINSKASKLGGNLNLPFEQTFRLKVYLPRNQLFVTRVSAHTSLSSVLATICKEKDLDPGKYELRHPANRDQALHLSSTLADYSICEVALVAVGKTEVVSASSWSAMPKNSGSNGSAIASAQPPKQKKGLFSFMFGKKQPKSSMGDSSPSSDSIGDCSLSPSRSQSPLTPDMSPATPPLATSSVIGVPASNGRMLPAKSMDTISMISDTSSSRGMFKKRQAPAPPPTNRLSSPLSKDQMSKLPGGDHRFSSPFSKSTTNLHYDNRPGNRLSVSNLTSTNSTSTSSILTALKKSKKAPPPPNPPATDSELKRGDDHRVEEGRPPPEPDGTKEPPLTSRSIEEPSLPVAVVPVEVVPEKKDLEVKESLSSSDESSLPGQDESVKDISDVGKDSLEIKEEIIVPNSVEEPLSYDDIANTSDSHEEVTAESDTYEDIDLSKENLEELTSIGLVATPESERNSVENGGVETTSGTGEMEEEVEGKKKEPVYAQVNKKKKDSKQEEQIPEVINIEVVTSPSSDTSDLNSSLNDSAIDIPHPSLDSPSSSPISTWEYRVPDPPTPFKDLSSDEEVSDIVSDLLNTASFQEALLNEECKSLFELNNLSELKNQSELDSLPEIKHSDGALSLIDTRDDIRGETLMEDLSETGPSALVIQEMDERVTATVTLSREQVGESSTDVSAQTHLVVNKLYETIGAQSLKELTTKDASQFSAILEELSATLHTSDNELKGIPPIPVTPPPSTSGDVSRRSSISSEHGTVPPSPLSDATVLRNPMRFSISTYKSRVEEEGFCYEKKLSRSESVKDGPVYKEFRPLRRRGSTDSDRQSTSSSKDENRDQNENILDLKYCEITENDNNIESALVITPDVPEEFRVEISQELETVGFARSVEPLTVYLHEEPLPPPVEESVELDVSRLEPVPVVEPPCTAFEIGSRVASVNSVDLPLPDPVAQLSLLLPAPSLFADDEDPEALHLQAEYLEFQQRILAYQQKRLGSTKRPKESENPESLVPSLIQAIPVHIEEKWDRQELIETPPPPMPFRCSSPKASPESPLRQPVKVDGPLTPVKSGGPLVVMLNEDHIRAFSEIIEEKELSPKRESLGEILPAPPKFESVYPLMLDGISQTESEDSQSVISVESSSRPESRASIRSDSVEDDSPRYRYQGPPKIVMETWRSRPSVHVSISANPVAAYNIEDIEARVSAKKEDKRSEQKVELRKNPSVVEPVKLRPVRVEPTPVPEVAVVEERSQVLRPKLSFEASRSAFESESEKRKVSLVRRTSIDTPRPFELKSSTQVRRPMFNPVQVGNKLVQPKMPFRVPEVRGFPLRPHAEVEEKPAVVEKSRNDLIAMARRPSAEREDAINLTEDRRSPVKARDEIDAARKIDVVVLRKITPAERPKSFDELEMSAPETRAAVLKPAPLRHAVSTDFQATFWNELNGIKLRPVSTKQIEVTVPNSTLPGPPPPPPMVSNGLPPPMPKKIVPNSRFQQQADPREELMSSIKSFGAGGRLKKTGTRLH